MPTRPLLLIWSLASTLGCSADGEPGKEDSGGATTVEDAPVELLHGGWKVKATDTTNAPVCADMGAQGADATLWAEVTVGEPDALEVLLGTRNLVGSRDQTGFDVRSDELIPADNPEGYGIFVGLVATVSDSTYFAGPLTYDIVTADGHCTIAMQAAGEWQYFEPPPPCTG